MIRSLGQLLLVATLGGLVPADAAQLEWQAGVNNGLEFGRLPISDSRQLYAALPVSEERNAYPIKVDESSYGIVTTARSALVMDVKTGMLLFAKNPDEIRSIGSVTKLMTALVFLESDPDLREMVELDVDEDLVYGGRIYLSFGDALKLEDVLAASLVGSDNSATQSLVRFSGMTQEDFISRMNEKAQEFGMTSTTFTDATGINATNLSTARDITKLLARARTIPVISKYTTTPQISVLQASGRAVDISNTDTLLTSYLNEGDYSIEVGKTGYLPQAGYVLSTLIREEEHEIYVVVMGAETIDARALEVKGLATWAFKTFKWPEEL